jgi:hypothetical protein
LFAALIGASIGGVTGAVGGAALGAGVATSSRLEKKPGGQSHEEEESASGPSPLHESTETELARLKERIAELEEQKRREAEMDPRRSSPSTDITDLPKFPS